MDPESRRELARILAYKNFFGKDIRIRETVKWRPGRDLNPGRVGLFLGWFFHRGFLRYFSDIWIRVFK